MASIGFCAFIFWLPQNSPEKMGITLLVNFYFRLSLNSILKTFNSKFLILNVKKILIVMEKLINIFDRYNLLHKHNLNFYPLHETVYNS